MSDYKLQTRIPQSTADKLFKVIKDIQEATPVAEITVSGVIRAALDEFIKDYNGNNEKFKSGINKDIQQQINSYIAYLNVITGVFISLDELNQKIVEEGIKSLIEKKGGLEYINKIAVEDADEFYQEFKKEMEEK